MSELSRDATSTTRASIFLRLRTPDQQPREMAWREFSIRYSPVIRGFARDLGARAHEVDEVVQHVLVSFYKRSPKFVYDPSVGSFRGYLKVATLNCIRRLAGSKKFTSTIALEQVPDDGERLTEIWERQWRKQILARALRELRLEMPGSRPLKAFEKYVLKNEPAEAVALDLGMSVNAVHKAKQRISEALRERVARIDSEES